MYESMFVCNVCVCVCVCVMGRSSTGLQREFIHVSVITLSNHDLVNDNTNT